MRQGIAAFNLYGAYPPPLETAPSDKLEYSAIEAAGAGNEGLSSCEMPPSRLCAQLFCRHYALCLPLNNTNFAASYHELGGKTTAYTAGSSGLHRRGFARAPAGIRAYTRSRRRTAGGRAKRGRGGLPRDAAGQIFLRQCFLGGRGDPG